MRVSADPTGTAGTIVLQVSGLTVGLGDLLPADMLNALPLSVVLDLVDTLDLPVTTDLLDRIARGLRTETPGSLMVGAPGGQPPR